MPLVVESTPKRNSPDIQIKQGGNAEENLAFASSLLDVRVMLAE